MRIQPLVQTWWCLFFLFLFLFDLRQRVLVLKTTALRFSSQPVRHPALSLGKPVLTSPLQVAQFTVEHFSGMHNWYACSHARPTFCNVCRESLSGVTSHGLSCEGTVTSSTCPASTPATLSTRRCWHRRETPPPAPPGKQSPRWKPGLGASRREPGLGFTGASRGAQPA